MINYLARRADPTGYVKFAPQSPHWIAFGEERILRAFEEHGPDYIALVNQDTSAFGYDYFGQKQGRRLAAWIHSHYEQVALVGQSQTGDGSFGILLLRRGNNSEPSSTFPH